MLQNYRKIVFNHFGVGSIKALQSNAEFCSLSKETIFSFRLKKTWEEIYELISNQSAYEAENFESPIMYKETHSKNSCEDVGSWVELQDHIGNTTGALLQYSPEQSQQLIEHFRSLSLHSEKSWHGGDISKAVVDQLGATSSIVAAGLQEGQLFRAVGSAELIQGIQAGTHYMVQGSKGVFGSVKAVGGGGFAGNLQFSQSSLAPILAPVVAYQILHAIVGTQQLNQINQRLDKIQRTLKSLQIREEATILGEIHASLNILEDIFAERMQTGIFTQDMSIRLAQAEKSILTMLERDRILVNFFSEKAKEVKNHKGKRGAHSMAELLNEDGSQAIHDMQCLVGLVAADLKVEQARLLLAIQNNPADVGRRQERIHKKMEDYRQVLTDLPSVEKLKQHAYDCLEAMHWWDRHIFQRSTVDEVGKIGSLGLKDVKPQLATLNPSLDGYVFWKDQNGTHVLALPGDDLEVKPVESQKIKRRRQSRPS